MLSADECEDVADEVTAHYVQPPSAIAIATDEGIDCLPGDICPPRSCRHPAWFTRSSDLRGMEHEVAVLLARRKLTQRKRAFSDDNVEHVGRGILLSRRSFVADARLCEYDVRELMQLYLYAPEPVVLRRLSDFPQLRLRVVASTRPTARRPFGVAVR